MVQRFTEIAGSTLKIFYTLSTWNPYAAVMMESDFNISYGPAVSLVVNAEGGGPAIAPNTWVQINGANLAPAGDSRTWKNSDFTNGMLPTQLDGVSVTVNGKNAFVYYISPTQVNILTPPDAMTGPVQVVVTNGGTAGAGFTAQAQATSPSFFVFNGGPYVAAVHANGGLIGPATLYPEFHDSGQTGRGRRTIRKRLRTNLDACGQRIHDAIRKSHSPASDKNRRNCRHGPIRGIGRSR